MMEQKKILLVIFILFGGFQAFSQCANVQIDLGPDTALCAGDSFTINAGSGFLNYFWNNGDNDSTTTVGTSGVYTCTSVLLDSTNLVQNGDFSLGNTGFTSAYIYGTGGTWGLLSNPGQYAISTNANLTHTNFANCPDHTTGTGNYMIMNGAQTANTDAWCQSITVTPNTTYAFSAWFTSVVSGNPANLNFKINGSTVGSNFVLSNTTCSWAQYSTLWTSGPTTTVATICITNQNTAGGGNDFGMDDIFFGEICQFTDSIVVDFLPIPVVDLGNDTVICTGNTLSLDVTDSNYTYLWSTGNTSPIQNITSTDSSLWVEVNNQGCIGSDTMIVTSAPFPTVNLGNDSLLCPGDTLGLDASWPYATYLWQDNSTDTGYVVQGPGTYWVQVTDQCGTNSDTVVVDYVSFPLVDLGPDTLLCVGDTLPYDITILNGSYLWSDNTTSPVKDIVNSGIYSVSVTQYGCTDRDTVNVTFNPVPTVNFGNDTTLCQGESIVLQPGNNNSTYLWQDGSTNSLFFVAISGTYWVEVTRINCVNSDTITIDFIPLPNPDLGKDTSLCTGDQLTLNAGHPNSTYVWQDGSTDSTFNVTQAGTYWVEVTNICATVAETINIQYNPIPNVNLGSDTTICEGNELVLSAKVSGGKYVWSTGSTSPDITVTESGIYSVTVTAKGCSKTDEIDVDVSVLNIDLGADTVICSNNPLVLDASTPGGQYLWQDGATSATYVVNSSGSYFVNVTVGICEGGDTIFVEAQDCEVVLTMPNIITPNGDGENDIFQPILLAGQAEIEVKIINRWGGEVYSTTNPNVEWPGTNNGGEDLPEGTYFWVANITGKDGNSYKFSGNVTLLR